MKQKQRIKALWIAASVALMAAGLIMSLLVFAGSEQTTFTATAYVDVVRFEAEGVASFRVRIFDLSGKEVWDSGMASDWAVDWDRRNDFGERLAYGAYIFNAQGWSNADELILAKTGKVVLLPGDQVQLQSAPVALNSGAVDAGNPARTPSVSAQAIAGDHLTETWAFGRVLVNTSDETGTAKLKIDGTVTGAWQSQFLVQDGMTGGRFSVSEWTSIVGAYLPVFVFKSSGVPGFGGGSVGEMTIADDVLRAEAAAVVVQGQRTDRTQLVNANVFAVRNYSTPLLTVTNSGDVGIGTTSPTAKLEVESSTGQDLIAAYNSSNRVLVVKSTGEVRADGTVYAADFHTGSADVAERINSSEWVEAGDVVEIDPDHPGFFRKASSPYSTKVAGIISTSPGVILGNSFDEATDEWDDNRPVLAIAGRVPVKASTESGPIAVGDLLVSSSVPGVAMKGDSEGAIGAVVGKAMEPLDEGEGTIMVQVMLR